MDIKVGQALYDGKNHRIVERVGRKYIYLENDNRARYHKDSLTLDTQIGSSKKLYLSKEEHDNIVKKDQLIQYLKHFNNGYNNWQGLTLEQLDSITQIIKNKDAKGGSL